MPALDIRSLASYVRRVRAEKRLTFAQIKERGGPAPSWMSSLENETIIDQPKPSTLEKIARGLGVPLLEVIKATGQIETLSARELAALETLETLTSETVNVRYYGRVGCGQALDVCGEPAGVRPVPIKLLNGRDKLKVATVEAEGDSMNLAGIHSGMILLMECDRVPKPGDVVIVTMPLMGTVCKRLERRADGDWLVSESSSLHPPIKLQEGVKINGVVMEGWTHVSFR